MARAFLYPTLLTSFLFFIMSLAFAQVPPRDAVGVRVFKNLEGLSAADWYRDQCTATTTKPKAFLKCGTPTPIVVDGYDGIRDGNTVYVNAANKAIDGKIYTNIYLLAVAEGASPGGSAVFDQILKNVKFPTTTPPLSLEDAAKLRRDVRRHAQLMSLRRFLDAYGVANSSCSVKKTQSCSTASQCPQGETCVPRYPTLAAGTYIPKVSFSTWPSWQQALGQALGATLPTDSGRPYLLPDPKDATKLTWQWKNFIGCGTPYDPETCWDARKATMACPLQAYVFAYRYSESDATYTLTTTYESSNFPDTWGEWGSEVHDPQTWATGTNKFCTALSSDPDADRDADGVKDRFDNCPEDPNPILLGQTKQTDSDNDGKGDVCDFVMRTINNVNQKIFCPRDDRNDSDEDGICANNDSCPFATNTGQDRDNDGIDDVCDSLFCGNGRIDAGEQCDTVGAPANATCRADCTAWTCNTGYRAYNNACELDRCEGPTSQTCAIANGAGSQTRSCDTSQHPPAFTAWGTCTVASCNSGYRVYNNTCERDGCDGPTTQSCAITNGQGTQSRSCDTNAHPPSYGNWGTCAVASCNAGYHEEGGQCVRNECPVGGNVRPCNPQPLNTTGGTQTAGTCDRATNPGAWKDWGACTGWTCSADFHQDGQRCDANVITCLTMPANTTAGTQTWTGSRYGPCVATACNDGFHVEANVCVSNMRSCAVTNGSGAQTWTRTAGWGACVATACNDGFHAEGNACVSNTRACDPLPSAATAGTQTWTATGWGTCTVTSCAAGFYPNGALCSPFYRCVSAGTCPSEEGTGWDCGLTCTVTESRENIPGPTSCSGTKSSPRAVQGRSSGKWRIQCDNPPADCTCPATTY